MEEKKDRTERVLQLLEFLKDLAIDFDVTFSAEDTDIGRIARLAGENFWEFDLLATEDGKKIIRIRD